MRVRIKNICLSHPLCLPCLVEVQRVQEVVQLAVLLALVEHDVVLHEAWARGRGEK